MCVSQKDVSGYEWKYASKLTRSIKQLGHCLPRIFESIPVGDTDVDTVDGSDVGTVDGSEEPVISKTQNLLLTMEGH